MPLSPSQTNQLLQQLGHEPRKQLGQNFLIDGNIVQKSVRMADLQAGERVVEVGPGLGTLTECMLEKGAHVYAVEFDRRLYEHLRESLLPRFADTLHLLHADALDHPLAQLPVAELLAQAAPTNAPDTPAITDQSSATNQAATNEQCSATNQAATNEQSSDTSQNIDRNRSADITTCTADFKIIANLPYAISTPWLEAVLSGPVRPQRLVLMLQKEAAERFVAEPGTKTYGAISIYTASAYRVAASHTVNRQCFYPIPNVDSMLLSLEALPNPHPWPPLARHFVRQFFIHRRKQIGSLVRRAIEELTRATEAKKPSAKARKAAAQAEATSDEPLAACATAEAHRAAEHLHNWLESLQAQGTPQETRPEAIPLKHWQQLAAYF